MEALIPKKKFRLVYQGKTKTTLDSLTLSQYAALFDLKELKDSLEQVGIKQDHPFERTGKTLLHGACFFGFSTLFCFLLNHNVDPNIQDELGNTPLHATLGSSFLTEEQKHSTAFVLLKMYKADVNKVNTRNETPLHLACAQGMSSLIHLFLHQGADAHLKDCNEKIPIDLISPLPKEMKEKILYIFNKFSQGRPDEKKIDQLLNNIKDSQVELLKDAKKSS